MVATLERFRDKGIYNPSDASIFFGVRGLNQAPHEDSLSMYGACARYHVHRLPSTFPFFMLCHIHRHKCFFFFFLSRMEVKGSGPLAAWQPSKLRTPLPRDHRTTFSLSNLGEQLDSDTWGAYGREPLCAAHQGSLGSLNR